MVEKGFDSDIYMRRQSAEILKRISMFSGKLYLEFGGKLFDDYHASRVLPGFEPDAKIKLLQHLKEKTEVVFCISASSIETTKIRADLGISYDIDVLQKIEDLKAMGIAVNSVVITQYTGQPAADGFQRRLESRGIKSYIHRPIAGYPNDVDYIVSDDGFGANPYIETTKPLVVVTAPGPGSGKLATCLSQVYHEHKRGLNSGYGKYETFPIWNLPLKHPVNLAYEAATADLQDVNMIDPYHLEEYGVTTVNYNRDIEAFPIVHKILSKITDDDKCYCSPTDMGVNMAGYAIIDDAACRRASADEIIRRYYKAVVDYRQGKEKLETVEKIEAIMGSISLKPTMRSTVLPALEKEEKTGVAAAAVELKDGRIITGKASTLMSATSSVILNSIKALADIDDEKLLISPDVLEPVLEMKTKLLKSRSSMLKLDDVLIALYICSTHDEVAKKAVEQLPKLRGCEIHNSRIIYTGDAGTLRKLGLNATNEAKLPEKTHYKY